MSLLPTIVNWYGGKQKLAHQIISIMPSHEHYVEVFMGSGAVFFNKPKVVKNTLNDSNHNLINLFIQVRDNFDELAEKVYWTLYSREEYKKFYRKYYAGFPDISDLDKALMYLFLVRASFNSRVGLGFSASIDSNSANFNLNLIDRMKLAREKLDGVVIENRDCNDIIRKYDVKGVLMYLDPPYYITLKEKTYYEKVFSEKQHRDLAFWLSECKHAKWILSYDDIPEIVDLYKNFYTQRLSVTYSTGASEKRESKSRIRKINELLICNFQPKKPQLDIFDESLTKVEFIDDNEKNSTTGNYRLKHEIELKKKLEGEDDSKRNNRKFSNGQLGIFDS